MLCFFSEMDNLVSNSDDYETLLLYLQQLANDYSPVALGNKVWIVLGGSFLVIVGLFVALCKIERKFWQFFKSVN